MWGDKTSIQAKFLRNMISIALVSIGLWCLIWVYGEYSAFNVESESMRAEYIESQKQILQSEVAGVVKYVKYMKAQAELELKLALKDRVYEAHQIALNIYRKNKESKTPSEIGNMIKDALRPIRFNDGRGYYFAVSMDGVEQLYLVRPEFEGKNLIDLQDSKGNFIIRDEIDVIKKFGEGFVKDYWTKPDKGTGVLFPKISFVKYFKPYDWYFGTGEYLDDAKKQIQNEVLNRIADLRFGTEGYFFGSTFRGGALFSNGKITLDGGNIWELTDPNGVKIIQEQRKAVENPEGGFVYYSWHKIGTSILSPKMSFVLGIPEWEWTIGAGVYMDTVENMISTKRETLENGIRKKIINSIFAMVMLFLLICFWSNRIVNQMTKAIEAFSLSLKKATTDAIEINPKDIHLREFRDIAVLTNGILSARKQALEALRENEEKYRAVVEDTPVLICRFISGGIITFVNDAYCRYFDKSSDQLIGRSFFSFIPETDRKSVMTNLSSLTAQLPIQTHEHRVISPDGDLCWQKWTNHAMFNEQGEVTAYQAIGEDITDLKKIEVQLQQAQKMESIGNLAGGIAHDFNNILSSVIGFTELAMDGVAKGSQLEDNLQEVYTAGKRARDLVKQILTFARQTDEEIKPVKVKTVAKEALKLLRASIPTTIEIKQKIESDSLIMGDSTQVHQVFMNLCTNAAHAMQDHGGVLEVGLTDIEVDAKRKTAATLKSGAYIKLWVSDTGPGITPDIIESIFEPYFTTKEVGEGTGMGLAMVHGIVERHGGKITLESELGRGTLFSIYLPIIRKHPADQSFVQESLPSGTERILFVDDELPIAKMGSQILERLGYQVTVCTSSVEALALFRSKPDDFDLVITDMTMPNMTGDKLAIELIRIRSNISVVLFTGYSKKISDEWALGIGIKAFAYKPLVKADLAKTVRKVLDAC